MREFRPEPETSGALQPPNRYPPTAVGVDTPAPEPDGREFVRLPAKRSLFARALRLAIGIPVVGLALAFKRARGLVHRA